MFARTVERVPEHTREEYNRKIQREVEVNVAHYASLGPEAIDERLEELDEEWDIERVLEANASTLAFLGTALASRKKAWLLLPAVVSGFLLQHAIQGWCPPVGFFRRCGFRTEKEINQERYALKALRGDFHSFEKDRNSSAKNRILRALEAVER